MGAYKTVDTIIVSLELIQEVQRQSALTIVAINY